MMELKEKKKKKNQRDASDNVYVNTAIRQSDLSLVRTEENEYEVLQRGTGTFGQAKFEKAPTKLSKRLVYVLFGLFIPLYVAAVAVVIVLNIPKGSEIVNGLWSSWGEWGNCSATCDFGMERRERSCTDPKPEIGGEYCTGEPVEYRLCKNHSCEVVNGNWSDWTEWDNCSATCDYGMKRRERSCTNPEPGIGGKYCSGEPVEYQTCKEKSCTVVNGNWSSWTIWGNCSAICDYGMKRRERSCTSPEPGIGGKYCSGEPVEYQTCKEKSCTVVNGNWSSWTSWGNCSATCDYGMKRRERSCTYPEPGIGGKYCSGEPVEYQTCKEKSCTVGWSSWSSWSSCSLSCGGGIQYRSRSCTNPSELEMSCIGDPVQIQACSTSRCPSVTTGFSVHYPWTITNNRLTFYYTIYQQGSDFNTSTGMFTCSIPGTYLFSVNLVKVRSSTAAISSVYCYLYKFRTSYERLAYIYVNPWEGDPDKGNAAVSSTVVTSLKLGDTVQLMDCSSASSMEWSSSFTGVLLIPD